MSALSEVLLVSLLSSRCGGSILPEVPFDKEQICPTSAIAIGTHLFLGWQLMVHGFADLLPAVVHRMLAFGW